MADKNPINSRPDPIVEPYDLDDLKSLKRIEIDAKTKQLIFYGFTYDGKIFSMSEVSQLNWTNLKQAAQNELISYPFGISTKDDYEYLLQNKTDVDDLYVAGLGFKISILSSGRALKVAVNNATTEAELDAVVDNR